jgi:divalent metal cation (Fe/Co/Zn/Cd) transporter
LRIVGWCFVALAIYVAYEAVRNLVGHEAAARSLPGILLACVSLVVMPLLSRAKRRVGTAMHSRAVHANAKQAEFCTHLSAILLGGLVLNTLWGWCWADSIAAFVMVPIIAKEGTDGLRGDPVVTRLGFGVAEPFSHASPRGVMCLDATRASS